MKMFAVCHTIALPQSTLTKSGGACLLGTSVRAG